MSFSIIFQTFTKNFKILFCFVRYLTKCVFYFCTSVVLNSFWNFLIVTVGKSIALLLPSASTRLLFCFIFNGH